MKGVCEGRAVKTLMATGSEVAVAMAAADLLEKDGIKAAVVSMLRSSSS